MLTVHHLSPPDPAHGPDLSANPSAEGPLDLKLADLLVELSNKSFIGLLALIVVPTKDSRGSRQQGFFPGLYLAGMDLVPGGQLGHRLFTFNRLQSHFGLE
jgi:hypothetical protein